MKKILILQNKILHYRKPLYNKLSENYDLTVLHSGAKSVEEGDMYKEKIVPVRSILKLKFQKGVLREVKNGKYYAVIAMLDIHWINNIIASFFIPQKTKFIWWGIMISENNFGNKIRAKILNRNLPAIFYTQQGILDMEKFGAKSDNFTFCNNTIHIKNRIKCYQYEDKNCILFVGSLDHRKRIDILISSFASIQNQIKSNIKIDIIGEGIEKENIKNQIKELGLTEKINLHGEITSMDELGTFYKNAICSVSYGQAGLAVLQSFGFGVPFVTKENAVSGGEITNIIHKMNGFICDSNPDTLSEFLLQLCNNPLLGKEMGKNAYKHYNQYCSIEHMASKFQKAID